MTNESAIQIVTGYIPGSIGRISEMHGAYYHHHWGFGLYFEAKVATELSEFLLRYDENRDGIWIATANDRVQGAIVIDGLDVDREGAHLRWFIVSDAFRGKGVGRRLLERAIGFCRAKAYPTVYLWTFDGLHAARRLYEAFGFKLIRQQTGVQWGTMVCEQVFKLWIDRSNII